MNFFGLRPFQIIFIAVFVLLALVGLYLFASFSGFGGGTKSIGTVVIWGALPQESVDAGLRALRQTDKGYSNVVYVERPAATMGRDLADAIAAGAGPDLIIVTQEELMGERNKLSVIPYSAISERTFRDSFLPIGELFLATEGMYGIPVTVDPIVLYYNRTMLSTNGIVRPPSTWEAVTGLVPLLTARTPEGTITKSTIALGEYENIDNARAIISLLFLQSGSEISRKTSNGSVQASFAGGASATGIAPAESALNFYTQFANPAKTTYSWNRALRNSRQTFLAGDSAFYLGYASEQPMLAAGNPNLDFDMASVPQPGTSSVRATYARAYAFAIPKASKNADGALASALALIAKERIILIAREAAMAPATRSTLVPADGEIYTPVFYPQALVARGWLSPAPLTTDAIFETMISDITTGRRLTRDALSIAERALNAQLP